MLATHLRGEHAIRSGPGAFPVGEEKLAAMRSESLDPFLEAARANAFDAATFV